VKTKIKNKGGESMQDMTFVKNKCKIKMPALKVIVEPGYSSFKFGVIYPYEIDPRIGNSMFWRDPTSIYHLPDLLYFDALERGKIALDASYIVIKDGERYIVGEDLDIGERVFRYDYFEFLYEQALPLFLLKLQNECMLDGIIDFVALCVRPLDFDRRERISSIVRETLCGVETVKLIPRGLGAWVLSKMPDYCVVCNIGYFTVDFFFFGGKKFYKKRCYSYIGDGVVSFLKLLSEYESVDFYDLMQLLKGGDQQVKETLLKYYPDHLFSVVNGYLSSYVRTLTSAPVKVIFTGEGALFIPKKIPDKKSPFRYTIVKDPVYANIMGVSDYIEATFAEI